MQKKIYYSKMLIYNSNKLRSFRSCFASFLIPLHYVDSLLLSLQEYMLVYVDIHIQSNTIK